MRQLPLNGQCGKIVHLELSSTPRILHEEIAEFHALKLGMTLSKAAIFTSLRVDQMEWLFMPKTRNVSYLHSLTLRTL